VALIGFVVLIAVIIAVVAVLDARQKARATDEGADTARTASPGFGALFRGRARFVLTLEAEGASPDGQVVTMSEGPTMQLVVRVGLTNVGEKAARRTTLRVLVPRESDAGWVGAETKLDPELTAERLSAGENQVEAWCVTGVLARVGIRDHRVVALSLGVRVPSEVPIRFRADAAELADDEDSVIDRLFVVRRAA